MPKRKPNCVDKNIGRRIRQRRHDWNISPFALAAAIDISHEQVRKYELGINRVPASLLWDISIELDVPIQWFFEEAKNQNSFEV